MSSVGHCSTARSLNLRCFLLLLLFILLQCPLVHVFIVITVFYPVLTTFTLRFTDLDVYSVRGSYRARSKHPVSLAVPVVTEQVLRRFAHFLPVSGGTEL